MVINTPKRLLGISIILTLSIFSSGNGFTKDSKRLDLKKIRSLINSKKPQQALSQMKPYVNNNIGSIPFDYLYGMASADARKPVQAIFALERVLAQYPDFAGARLELARAYYYHGETQKAKIEFKNTLALNPPEKTRKRIQVYLDRINGTKETFNKPWAAQLGLSIGQDSNANSATSDSRFLGFNLDPQSRATASTFSKLSALGIYKFELQKKHNLLLSAQYDTKYNLDASFANVNNLGIGATMQSSSDKTDINYGITYNDVTVSGSPSNSAWALNASIGNKPVNGKYSSLYLKYAAIRYTPSLSIQDVDQLIGGYTSKKPFNKNRTNLWSWSIILGTASALSNTSPYGKFIVGARTSFDFIVNRQLRWKAGAGILANTYDDTFYGKNRNDTSFNYELLANYKLYKEWNIRGGITGVNNSSSISLYEYNKSVLSIESLWAF